MGCDIRRGFAVNLLLGHYPVRGHPLIEFGFLEVEFAVPLVVGYLLVTRKRVDTFERVACVKGCFLCCEGFLCSYEGGCFEPVEPLIHVLLEFLCHD